MESQLGQGSTFHFTARFPVHILPATRRTNLRPVELRDQSVLIVDDNLTNRRVLLGMLHRWGMRPVAVDGGNAALAELERAKRAGRPYPLVLLDGHMPEMDGFTLAGQIQSNPHLVDATIMMLTSAGHMGDVARCRELGISAYLTKPIRQSELLRTVCQVMQQRVPELRIPASGTEAPKPSGRRVLLAEDNAVNQALAVRLLEKRGLSRDRGCRTGWPQSRRCARNGSTWC